MSTPLLATKLFVPRPRPQGVARPHLLARLDKGLAGKLTLVSASAGFGKTTLVADWVRASQRPAGWLSLEADDSDPSRFLAYFVAALQTIAPSLGQSALGASQPPPGDVLLTMLINEIAVHPEPLTLVLDDYHLVEAPAVDQALCFLLEHLPPQLHLVIVTREDPNLPLPSLRAKGQLNELRLADLRFSVTEVNQFLNEALKLGLGHEAVAALASRTEGWIAGLQLAGISLQGQANTSDFVNSFTGSHHFILDYLLAEVLGQQTAEVQQFLLQTALLDRFCAPLCDAVLGAAAQSSQAVLTYLTAANLFIIPLDDERRWFRYHHLFGDLLRQRFQSQHGGQAQELARSLHSRASHWFAAQGFEFEAFHHAAAAADIPRAIKLIEGRGMPLHFRGGVAPVRQWLATLPEATLDDRPILWTTYASVLLASGQLEASERALAAAEAALPTPLPDDVALRDIFGRIAAIRATLAASRYQVPAIISLSEQALDYLRPDNLAFRTSTNWKLGYAYHLLGEREAATKAYQQVIDISRASGNLMFMTIAQIGLGSLLYMNNQLVAAERLLAALLPRLDQTLTPAACEAYGTLADIYYQWNDLEKAAALAEQSKAVAGQYDDRNRLVGCAVRTAQLQLTGGEIGPAAATIARARQQAEQYGFANRTPEIDTVELAILLRENKLVEAEMLVERSGSPVAQARLHLAQNRPAAAINLLVPYLSDVATKGWPDQIAVARILLALAQQAGGELEAALEQLDAALAATAANNILRLYLDEGEPMAQLLSQAAARGYQGDYVARLLAALAETTGRPQPLAEALSPRELEVLALIAQGLSNREISERLFLALSTVKGHNRLIFDKLAVRRRTEAVARARELGLL